MEQKIVYFEKPGGENTDAVLRIAEKRAEELGIKTVVVASNTGATGIKALEVFKGRKVVTVTHSVGFREENVNEFKEENRPIIENKGGYILTTTHAFGGISRAMRQGEIPGCTQTYVVGDIAASTLKMLCQGMKVTIEIAAMAADAGLVRTDEEVISIAGTGSRGGGSDTAVVLQPAHVQNIFATQVKEILCKPRL